MFELLLKVCWKSSRFWAVFGASQGKISSRQELEVDLTYRDTNERGFNDGTSSMWLLPWGMYSSVSCLYREISCSTKLWLALLNLCQFGICWACRESVSSVSSF